MGCWGKVDYIKENLQLDPPNSRLLFMKCASLGFLFEHAWTLSSTQQGQYLHILMDIMEKVADGVISPMFTILCPLILCLRQ
ncbi:hypothetical protein JTE90_007589 [Oedothorax gibbosus]|uniref:Uncharacterized protein n=1 Tax=Oedothorax gibbosus TaxID=931172 RepID=A0AAV6TIX2_9ARAC|nr:hypothetical protein JTE90_007589 [Oedothorax gibbosus]